MPANDLPVKTKLRSFFKTRPEVIFAYLFGSIARGTAGKLSDIGLGHSTWATIGHLNGFGRR